MGTMLVVVVIVVDVLFIKVSIYKVDAFFLYDLERSLYIKITSISRVLSLLICWRQDTCMSLALVNMLSQVERRCGHCIICSH